MAHRVFPHGKPERLSEGVWLVKGGLAFPMFRNMVVVRLQSGELLLHSAVAMDEAGLRALEALGKPAYALVPHAGHQMDAPFYKARYPDIKVIAPAVHREAVEKNAAVAGTAEEVMPGLGFVLHAVPGSRTPEYVCEWPLPAGGRMLIVNDALGSANTADESKLMGRLLLRHTGAPGNRLGIARLYRMAMVKDMATLKGFVASLAAIPDVRLLTVSHGDPVNGNVSEALRAAAG